MYDKLAAVYDRFMLEDVDYKAYASWINEILSKRIGKRKNLLEVGCGTGNITMEMHDLGYEVTGLDISEEMLVEADNKAFAAGADIQWIQGDISRLSLPARFDAVISTMDTFNYLLEEKELKEALHKVYESLRPGGTFIFDVNTPYRLETVYGNNSFHYLGDDVCYIWECHYDQVLDICSYDIAFFVQDTGIDTSVLTSIMSKDPIHRSICPNGLKMQGLWMWRSLILQQRKRRRAYRKKSFWSPKRGDDRW